MSKAIPETLLAAGAALRSGEWSSEALCEWTLDRAHAIAPLNAFVALEAQAAQAGAAAADRIRRAQGSSPDAAPLPALHGIPLAHKDLFYRPDRAPGCGSRAPAPPHPGLEATVLARLRTAGALDLGPLHLSEFAYGPTGHNAALGPARNPWNPDHVTGGSSSGSAVAVATGAVYASLGSDSGGSIRTPASWCGITGLKPTRGAIALTGTMALAPTMDSIGILARSAEDIAMVFARLAGSDGMDAATRGAPPYSPDAVARALQRVPRLGIIDHWFDEDLDGDIALGLDAIRHCWAEQFGARVVSARFPGILECVAHARTVLLREAWRTHEPLLERHDSLYSSGVRARLMAGSEIEQGACQAALQAMPGLLQQLADHAFKDADVLLLPCNPGTAPRIDQTDLGASVDPAPALLRQVDAITRCLRPFNYLGLPSLVLPGGFDRQGLPFGFQLVGKPFQEASLLALGMRWQTQTDWHRHAPPGYPMR